MYNSPFTVLQLFTYKPYHNLLLNFWSDKKKTDPNDQSATSNTECTGLCLHLVVGGVSTNSTHLDMHSAFIFALCGPDVMLNVMMKQKIQTPIHLSQTNTGSE